MNSTGVTLAGLVTALVITYFNLRPWWVGGREAKLLAPFGKGSALGLISAVCPGGILGWLHSHSAGAADTGGSRLTGSATGIRPSAPIAHRDLGGLDQNGAVIAVLIALAVALAWKFAGKKDKKRIVGGAFVTSVLCLTAGVAGALTWVPGLLNSTGASAVHAIGQSL
jgi:hypothetical protein